MITVREISTRSAVPDFYCKPFSLAQGKLFSLRTGPFGYAQGMFLTFYISIVPLCLCNRSLGACISHFVFQATGPENQATEYVGQ